MKLSEIKEILKTVETVEFQLPDGSFVPEHFHVTEIGSITKKFIDCGGTVRKETIVNFQLWDANDYEHRLKPQKLAHIIELSEKILAIKDDEIEVEYQSGTIGKYDLAFNGKYFMLVAKNTACLASENCGTNEQQKGFSVVNQTECCTPKSVCC